MNDTEHNPTNRSNVSALVDRYRTAQTDVPPVGQRLRALRRLRDLTLRELAAQARLSYQGLQALETRADPRLSTLYRLCAALGVEPVDILDAARFRVALARLADDDPDAGSQSS
ncbi:MAG TPA: helix-turn-helix domain-containing protein [bacterium]|nr:helix-turn-helix domain-containing protein [bacterium]